MTRGAFITAVVTAVMAIALNPISIFIGYYLSKSLAAPKLSIQYITPVVQTEPLALDKSVVTHLTNPSVPLPIMPAYADPYSQCTAQFRSFSLSLDCAKFYQTRVQQDLDALKSRQQTVQEDIRAVSAWNGETPLSLPVLYLPGEQPLEFPYMPKAEKGSTLALLHQWDKVFDKAIQLNNAF